MFEAPGTQKTKRQKERTCKTCNALEITEVETIFNLCMPLLSTLSHWMYLACTALYTLPLASSSLLLAALSVPVPAQV